METPGTPNHKIGTKIRMGLAVGLGVVAAMFLLSGDTNTSNLAEATEQEFDNCDGTTIIAGDVLGVGDGKTYRACVTFTDEIGDLRYPTSTQPDRRIIP